MVGKFKSAWAITPSKYSNQNSKTTCTSSYHRKKVYIISNESNERCRRSCGDKIMVDKVYVNMGHNSVKDSRIKILKSHAHLHIIRRKSTKFQVNPMKDVGGVAETSSFG